MKENRPPELASRLVSRVTPAPDVNEMAGDLHERFLEISERHGSPAARRWYWGQALRLGFELLSHAVRRMPDDLWADLRVSGRSLRRSPMLVVAAAITLGIGISAPTTLFAVLDGLLRPLPVDSPQHVVDVTLFDPTDGSEVRIDGETLAAWQQADLGFQALGAYWEDGLAVSGPNVSPGRHSAAYVTAEILEITQARPLAGRLFDSRDFTASATPSAILGERVWEALFDRSPQALGSVLRINGKIHTVVGVVPEDFGFPEDQVLWMPLDEVTRRTRSLSVLGRLRPGVTAGAIEPALARIAADVRPPSSDPVTPVRAEVLEYVTAQMGEEMLLSARVLVQVTSLLVLIAAINVSSLLLARAVGRSQDVAVRLALGGSRFRVIGQLMGESAILSVFGALAGLLISVWGLAWCRSIVATHASQLYWMRLEISPQVIGFIVILAALAALGAGLLPALRTLGIDLAGAMKVGETHSGSVRMGRLLPGLVGFEMALSCGLLLLSALIVRGAVESTHAGAEFNTDRILTGRLVLEDYDYPDSASRIGFLGRLGERLDRDQLASRSALMTSLPGKEVGLTPVRVGGDTSDPEAGFPGAQIRSVTPAFFELFEMRLLAGRLLTAADRAGRPRVAVINEWLAAERFKGGSAVGERLTTRGIGESAADLDQWVEIVGVVSDRDVTVDYGRGRSGVFLPLVQDPPEVMFIAVAGGSGMLTRLQRELAGVDPDLPVGRVHTMAAVEARENADERLFGTLFGAFGVAALVLAAVGLCGIVSFSVSRRTREIGIRRAFGADSGSVFWGTVGRGIRPALIGMLLGVGLAFFLAPLLGEILYGTNPRDPWIFTLVPMGLFAVCLVAAFLPARRASRLDPVSVLRAD